MAQQKITELKRTGGGILTDTDVVFAWDSASHSMTQGELELELAVHTVRELPPGGEEPVEQVMGVEWTPFEIHGQWLDKWAGKGFAWTTYTAFAKLVGRTNLVRFELGAHAIVGILTRLKIRYRTDSEFYWSCTISPHRNDSIGQFRGTTPIQPVLEPSQKRLDDLNGSFSTLQALQPQALGIVSGSPAVETATDGLDELDDAVSRAQAASDAVTLQDSDQDAPLSTTLVDRTQSKLLALATAFRRVRQAADNVALSVSAIAATDVLAYPDTIAQLNFEDWARTTQTESVRTSGVARLGEADARARASQNPRAIYRTRRGDSLERISRKYYGTADNAMVIYAANNLSSLVLDDGVDLIIPDRTA